MIGPPELREPWLSPREASLAPLTLMSAAAFPPEALIALKQATSTPVIVAFPVAGPQEAANLRLLLAVLRPLAGPLVDQVWLTCGSADPGELALLPQSFPGLHLFMAPHDLPPDQEDAPLGKGAAMRALIHHLIVHQGLTHPESVILFLDADIRPAYFHLGWVTGPVAAVLRFHQVAAAKVVYWRPRGGRLNAMARALFALAPHPGVHALLQLAYLLSGEMAGTLRFWSRLPFRCGYGVEVQTLLAFALELLQLAPPAPDLSRLVQVYVGRMDHRHAPLASSRSRRGLDQMAGAVFFTFWDALARAGVCRWQAGDPLWEPRLLLPLARRGGELPPLWLETAVADPLLPRLTALPAVARALKKDAT